MLLKSHVKFASLNRRLQISASNLARAIRGLCKGDLIGDIRC